MIDTEILQDYSTEARELLEEMDNSLIRLENEGGSPELLNNIFRAVHCIKGSAEYIGLERSSTLTHGVESLLDRLREGALNLEPSVVDFLFRAKDRIASLIEEVSGHHQEKSEISALMEELKDIMEPGAKKEKRADLYEAAPDVEEQSTYEAFLKEPLTSEELHFEPLGEQGQPSEESPTAHFEEEPAEPEDIPDEPFFGPEETEAILRSAQWDDEPDSLFGQESNFDPEDGAEDEELQDEELASELLSGPDEELSEEPAEAGDQFGVDEHAPRLEDTIPYVLNISLYLDDLGDGLPLRNVLSDLFETVSYLIKAFDQMGIPEGSDILRRIEVQLAAISDIEDELPPVEVEGLRSYLRELQDLYPAGAFPAEEPPQEGIQDEELPTQEHEVEDEPEFHAEIAPIFQDLQRLSGIDPEVIRHVIDSGFTDMDELLAADTARLRSIPGMTPTILNLIRQSVVTLPEDTKTIEEPVFSVETESLMADVDDDLLNEFDEITVSEKPLALEIPAEPEPAIPSTVDSDLLADLNQLGGETDSELLEIFHSYGAEIVEKIKPIVHKIETGEIGGKDLEQCADAIKSIRASSTYMDYQKLASFLDDWYERTLWAAERIDSLQVSELSFVREGLGQLDTFLRNLGASLKPKPKPKAKPAPKARPAVAEPKPTAQPRPPRAVESPLGLEPTMMAALETPAERVELNVESVAKPMRPEASEAQVKPVETKTEERVAPPEIPTAVQEHVPAMDDVAGEEAAENAEAQEAVQGDRSPVVRTMRVDAEKVDSLLNQVGELVVNRSYVEQLSMDLKSLQRDLAAAVQVGKKDLQTIKGITLRMSEASLSLGRVATDLQEGVMKLRMLPVGQLFNRMPRLIRDLSRRVGKTVNLEVQGGDTEVDKRVIEQIYNPLVHIIRNAVDHGIESREERIARGKNPEGVIRLSAFSQGNQVIVEVEDDGGGIDRDAVLEKAVNNRLIDPADAKLASQQDVFGFLFVPGFSTSHKVTRTSGRGVGMDVVKKDVEKINGQVDIETWRERGTRISIKIPLTLAIIQTLMIKSGAHMFAVPLLSVREIIQISPREISTIEGFEVIKFRAETIPVLRIKEVFNLNGHEDGEAKFVVLTTSGQNTVGFLVEHLVGEMDVVIKPLAEHVCKSRGLAGSTILGDGTIALVMDVGELVEDVIARQKQLHQRGSLSQRDINNLMGTI